ncbi:MAG: hypothetical protein IPJ06_19975 [Saprospiraceae bacterium]|nr:hypothetical protein [Saprospiraceae bacterium]
MVRLAMGLGLMRSLFVAFVIAIFFGAMFYVLSGEAPWMVQAEQMARVT